MIELKHSILDLIANLRQIEAQGNDRVLIKPLIGVLEDTIRSSAPDKNDADRLLQKEMQLTQLNHDYNMEKWRANRETWKEMFIHTVQAGGESLKASIVINGGASIAVLAFIGNVFATDPALASNLSGPLLIFSLGTLAGTTGYGLRYFNHYFNSAYTDLDEDKKSTLKAKTFEFLWAFTFALAVFVWADSCWLFYSGVSESINAFQTIQIPK